MAGHGSNAGAKNENKESNLPLADFSGTVDLIVGFDPSWRKEKKFQNFSRRFGSRGIVSDRAAHGAEKERTAFGALICIVLRVGVPEVVSWHVFLGGSCDETQSRSGQGSNWLDEGFYSH